MDFYYLIFVLKHYYLQVLIGHKVKFEMKPLVDFLRKSQETYIFISRLYLLYKNKSQKSLIKIV